MPASNLQYALRVFSPLALRGTDLNLYYVERPRSPLNRMAVQLRTQRRLKVLFTGHRISGKTTALNALAVQLEDAFFIVHFSVLDTLNAYDVHYADLMLALAVRLLEQATDEKLFPKGIKTLVREDLLDDILRWFEQRIEGLQFVPTPVEKSLSGQVNFLTAQLEAKVSTETVTRQTLRERVSLHLSELLDRMRYVIDEVERRGQRQVLFIVEDIDKLDLANARDLFLEHARSLTAPPAAIIYTFPVALRYSLDFPQIAANFGRHFIWPNIRLFDPEGSPDPVGRQTLTEIFYRRLDRNLVTRDALDSLVAASGGLVGTLIRLGELAAEHALVDEKEVIDRDVVEQAIAEMRGDFKALLRKEDYEVLQRQLGGDRLLNEEAVRDVLYTGCLLEYHDHEPWFGVHPIVRPLVEREQREPSR
jgi:hypothetical protein